MTEGKSQGLVLKTRLSLCAEKCIISYWSGQNKPLADMVDIDLSRI